MPEPEKRLNIRVSESTHYWLNVDAAHNARSLQAHVNALLAERAEEVSRQHGGKRLDKE